MSLVIAIRTPTESILAADTFSLSGGIVPPRTRKLCEYAGCAVGFSGDTCTAQVLDVYEDASQSSAAWNFATSADVFHWALGLRRFARESCHLVRDDPADKDGCFAHVGQNFLLMEKAAGRLWWVTGDLSVNAIDDYWAVGSGRDVALGALAALWPDRERWDLSPEQIARRAIDIASRLTDGVRQPIDIVRVAR